MWLVKQFIRGLFRIAFVATVITTIGAAAIGFIYVMATHPFIVIPALFILLCIAAGDDMW